MKKRVFIDMDGTLYRFHDHIVDESGHVQIEKMYEPDFFIKLDPFENMKDAINLKYALQESLKQQDNEINPSLIVKLNEIINKNIKDTSGYRKIPVFIRGADFVPPEAKYVSNMVMEQLYFYNHSTLPLLERIADFHIQFEHIHPFEDGNGRTGRLLINHELIRNNEIPIVIPDNKRAEYFEYLQNYDVKGLAHMIEELQKVEKEKMNLYVKEIVSEDINKSIEEDFEDRDI